MPRWGFAVAVAVAIAAGMPAAPVLADVFSPGALSAAHSKLEGIKNCTQCHVAGAQLSQTRCLDCHTELKERIAKRAGFHGRLTDSERGCASCHHEHQGRDFQQIDWGAGGKERFAHKLTGFALLGKHAEARCDQCHLDRFVVDPAVKALRISHPKRETFLGAATSCSACHFDEHRGQLSAQCRDCHVEKGWKPAPGFNHAKTDFRLQGKHRTVECLKCHAQVLELDEGAPGPDTAAAKALPAPAGHERFSRYKPVEHNACSDCHKDPHEGRLGQDCTACHTVRDWLEVKQASSTGARAFHDKTRYPLRGAHAGVTCKACHGPGPDGPAVFKGMKFDTCMACHVDAHLGQLGHPPPSCDRCHTVEGFRPARYEVADHKTFALEGAHAAVPCLLCHLADRKLAAKAAPVHAWLQRRKRKDQLSLVSFHPPGDTRRCDTCHADAHHGQFATRLRKSGCADCHVVASFAQVRFDHADTRFPLADKHARVACASCHVPDAGGVVRYKPLELACASCHADPHAGQFAVGADAGGDCARCHDAKGWKPSSFVHRPPSTSFVLEGRHQQVACAACHRDVLAPRGVHVTRYKGLPTACAGCHVDVHRGAFEGFKP